MKSGEDALAVWKSHFETVFGCGGGEGGVEPVVIGWTQTRVCLNQVSAFVSRSPERRFHGLVVRKDVSPGMDGVVMDMMGSERLFEVWVALFGVCWQYGRVPFLWRESIIIPVPKKQGWGVCDVRFRGISLTSVVSKVLCKILESRLSSMAEEKGLIAEEQGGFRRNRECRDQILSLVLLGQAEMVKRNDGMLVAFLTFKGL